HGRTEAVASVSGFADEIVDARRRAVDTHPPPPLGLLGFVGDGVALDPADLAPRDEGDPVLRAVPRARAVVSDDPLPRHVVALPPPHHAGLVEGVVRDYGSDRKSTRLNSSH